MVSFPLRLWINGDNRPVIIDDRQHPPDDDVAVLRTEAVVGDETSSMGKVGDRIAGVVRHVTARCSNRALEKEGFTVAGVGGHRGIFVDDWFLNARYMLDSGRRLEDPLLVTL